MDFSERKNKIITLLNENEGKISFKKLASIIPISKSSLYKDLSILENQRLIKKYYGFIELVDLDKQQTNFNMRLQKNSEKKKAIAKAAVKLVNNEDTIFLDGSTTVFYFSEELKKTSLKNITIITNSVNIPNEFLLNDNFNVINSGGVLNKDLSTYGGFIWEQIVKENFYANKFFFSSSGISLDIGILDDYNQSEVNMKKAFSTKAAKKICLIDSEKFTIKGASNWIGFDDIDILITDEEINDKVLSELKRKKIEFIIAKLK